MNDENDYGRMASPVVHKKYQTIAVEAPRISNDTLRPRFHRLDPFPGHGAPRNIRIKAKRFGMKTSLDPLPRVPKLRKESMNQVAQSV